MKISIGREILILIYNAVKFNSIVFVDSLRGGAVLYSSSYLFFVGSFGLETC